MTNNLTSERRDSDYYETELPPAEIQRQMIEVGKRAWTKALLRDSDTPNQDAWKEWKVWLESQGLISSDQDCDYFTDDAEWLAILNNPDDCKGFTPIED